MNELLQYYIDEHSYLRSFLIGMYGRYLGNEDNIPVFNRNLPEYNKINNELNNDFIGSITKTKTGYMVGVPVVYSLNSEQKDKETAAEEVRKFTRRVNINRLNKESVKLNSLLGYSGRLAYINKDGELDLMNIYPWELIFIYDDSRKCLEKVIRYYDIEEIDEDTSVMSSVVLAEAERGNTNDGEPTTSPQGVETVSYVKKLVVEVYDSSNVTTYHKNTSTNDYYEVETRAHGFSQIPLVEYTNNEDKLGDCFKVLELIDAYDRIASDTTSEVEQLRLAYLALYGLEIQENPSDPDDETPLYPDDGSTFIQRLQKTGVFEMTMDGKAEFITKDLNIDPIDSLLNRLEKNIIKFAQSVDFSDENFYGNLSGIAIKYKLYNLENSTMDAQIDFEAAETNMWKVICEALNKKNGLDIDYLNVERSYTRNLPVNMVEEARVQRELMGTVSNETRLAQASFIDTPISEMERIKQEEEDFAMVQDYFYETLNDNLKGIKNNTAEEDPERREDRHDDLNPDAENKYSNTN
jgi:hypothetical protein